MPTGNPEEDEQLVINLTPGMCLRGVGMGEGEGSLEEVGEGGCG